jgi:hypothetical protein
MFSCGAAQLVINPFREGFTRAQDCVEQSLEFERKTHDEQAAQDQALVQSIASSFLRPYQDRMETSQLCSKLTHLFSRSNSSRELLVNPEESMNSRMSVAYCELLDEQRVYENAYKFESTPRLMAA